jgi:hypothetical protein
VSRSTRACQALITDSENGHSACRKRCAHWATFLAENVTKLTPRPHHGPAPWPWCPHLRGVGAAAAGLAAGVRPTVPLCAPQRSCAPTRALRRASPNTPRRREAPTLTRACAVLLPLTLLSPLLIETSFSHSWLKPRPQTLTGGTATQHATSPPSVRMQQQAGNVTRQGAPCGPWFTTRQTHPVSFLTSPHHACPHPHTQAPDCCLASRTAPRWRSATSSTGCGL